MKTSTGPARVVILKTGNTLPPIRDAFGDFDRWFLNGLSAELAREVVDVTCQPLPGEPDHWDGIVVTGSPAMVSDREPWSESTGDWLAKAIERGVPVLGVCYGHQLMAHALGGKVGYHPRGRETGSYPIRLHASAQEDPLFAGLPAEFPVQLTHRQSVLELPESAVLLASNDFEPHQAFRIGPCAWGVQFHPEFTADIMRAYLQAQTPALLAEGLSPEALTAGVEDSLHASSLLQRFSEFVIQSR
ncbi:glutamine amidotransferase [Marinobacter confluentis]|uniref:Glutamine amidotransferase n=1 Tax=Marinobacter confluentis TaxID=1697557 RepID=A0A4Z1C6F3_9GAMM|nr:glutamine amidotransferase [Marinobacter confluentis]TGN41130.1 glutamine amidotransferase [Marinobacter confluentis]